MHFGNHNLSEVQPTLEVHQYAFDYHTQDSLEQNHFSLQTDQQIQ